MRTHNHARSALLTATAAFAAAAVAFAGTASAQSTGLQGDCDSRDGTVITLDLEAYGVRGDNTARITLDGSEPSRVSFGKAYNWSSGSLDGSVDHTARVVVRAYNDRSGAAGRSFTDSITVAACQA